MHLSRYRIVLALGFAAALVLGAIIVQLLAGAIAMAHAGPDPDAARLALERLAPEYSDGASSVLLALAVAAALQVGLTWLARRPYVHRHLPRAVAFLQRPLMVSIVALVVADLLILAGPLQAGELTRMEAIGAIGGHVLGLMKPTLTALAAGGAGATS